VPPAFITFLPPPKGHVLDYYEKTRKGNHKKQKLKATLGFEFTTDHCHVSSTLKLP